MTHNISMRKIILIHAVKNYGRLAGYSAVRFTIDTIPYGMVLLRQATGRARLGC